MDGWMGGWVGGRAGLRIACSNQKQQSKIIHALLKTKCNLYLKPFNLSILTKTNRSSREFDTKPHKAGAFLVQEEDIYEPIENVPTVKGSTLRRLSGF